MLINLSDWLVLRYSFFCTPTYNRSELNKSAFHKVSTVLVCISPKNTEYSSVWKFTDSRVAVCFRITTLPQRLPGWPQRGMLFLGPK